MTDYINKAVAMRKLVDLPAELDAVAVQRCIEAIHSVPAADVRLNVHGKWVPKNSDGSWRVDTCSSCEKDTHYVRYAPAYDYCPNCGADMREGQL